MNDSRTENIIHLYHIQPVSRIPPSARSPTCPAAGMWDCDFYFLML